MNVNNPSDVAARSPREFPYLFGGADDLFFLEGVEATDVSQQLKAASDGQDVRLLTLLCLDAQRPSDIRRDASIELDEVLLENPGAAAFAERLLLSTPLPQTADLTGAIALSSGGAGRELLERLELFQSFVEQASSAWEAIPERVFSNEGDGRRHVVDGVLVREGVFRSFVRAASGEVSLDVALLEGLANPAVRSLPNYREVLEDWRQNLDVNPQIDEAIAVGVVSLEEKPRAKPRQKPRPRIDRPREKARVDRVKATIVAAMKDRAFDKVRDYVDQLVEEQVTKSGAVYACQSLCALAMQAQKLGLHALELELTSRSVEAKADDVWSWTQHGHALLNNTRPHEALWAYEQAIAFGGQTIGWRGHATALRALGRFSKSLAEFELVISLEPHDSYAKNGRAETLRSMGQLEQALNAYDAAIKDHPENVVAKTGRAETLRSLGRLEQALDAYDTVIKEYPESVFAKNGRACVLIGLERFADAMDDSFASHPISQGEWIGLHIRGMALMKKDLISDAVAVFEEGLANCPWPAQQKYFASALAVARLRRGEERRGLEVLAGVGDKSDSPATTLVRIHLLGACGQPDWAREASHRLPLTLVGVQEELRQELNLRYIEFQSPQQTDDWLFDRHTQSLLLVA